MIYNYLRARLSWKWRRKLVNELHDRYFSGMTYYVSPAPPPFPVLV